MATESERLEIWASERQTGGVSFGLKILRTLHEEQTPYQHLAVVETEAFGRTLFLDGMIQTTIGDEFVYHEMIAHVPLCAHPEPKSVLVVGGGDGGAVREILKHPSVERVVLVEIDGRVVEAARAYFPEIACGLDDRRVEVRIEDGLAHVARRQAEYDVVIVDSTEPVGAAIGLFAEPFYRDIKRALRPQGLMVAQTESPFYNRELIRRAHGGIRRVFGNAALYLAAIPTYPSGLWSFTIGSTGPKPHVGRPWDGKCRYYSPAVHAAAFALPPFVAQLLVERAPT